MEFLDKSRSLLSRTHTTSNAPAPSLAPATIAFTTTSKVIIEEYLHSDKGDPNNLGFLNAKDDASLKALAQKKLDFLQGRQETLAQCLLDAQNDNIHVTEKVKAFWRGKKDAIDALLEIYVDAGKTTSELDPAAAKKREVFLNTCRDAWDVGLKTILQQLTKEIIGPYILGKSTNLFQESTKCDIHPCRRTIVARRFASRRMVS